MMSALIYFLLLVLKLLLGLFLVGSGKAVSSGKNCFSTVYSGNGR